ncbi:hypothetical protein FBZ82_102516 [Azospirillum brasilense]|uniref:Restriction endonuclease n=1 Tax=Azospirillum brasilense TaxID=192 RepID=A0A560BJW7_AZOBR|nr:hypothetical protein [Azospirillum brasilense]TWA72914.1 hypothetical protein FBZ82_102516 [Azospirillum brasilense]
MAARKPAPKARDDEKDQILKLRMRRALWAQGYHCPVRVDLSHFEFKETGRLDRMSITDIDVLGIRFDPDLRRRVVVADCKSGAESGPNRMFWLSGIMRFFGADEGFFVKPSVNRHARPLASKLDIRVVDDKALEVLENGVNAESIKVRVGDKEADDFFIDNWGIKVPSGEAPTEGQIRVKSVFHYVQFMYWVMDEYRNIANIIDRFHHIKNDIDPFNVSHKILGYVGLQRLTLSILNMASVVYSRDVNELDRQIKLYFFGGTFFLRERERTVELLNNLFGSENDVMSLEPSYFGELSEITNRLIKNSSPSSKLLLHSDAVIYSFIVGGSDVKADMGNEYSLESIILLRRIADFFVKSAEMPPEMFHELSVL